MDRTSIGSCCTRDKGLEPVTSYSGASPQVDLAPHLTRGPRRAVETVTPSELSALKGLGNIAQGKCVSAPPWVEFSPLLSPLSPALSSHRGVKRASGAGRGEEQWGSAVDSQVGQS
jgi:hypothetical protein